MLGNNAAVLEVANLLEEEEVKWAKEKGVKMYRSKERKAQLIPFIYAKSTFSRLDCWSSKVFSKWKQKKKSQNPLEWNISIFPLVYG